ncbi:PD-(D/E)XK motif protein [Selenomonas ruminantium]|uniref:Putative PD-(D/E)XK family member n=1 Tax=Selenomonas ruminantium TaxID=971 RepID=A0A1H3YVJ4_SELRU|nr:PD-(D/E)XK motif protein [Selenomonas ruminantium]SEA15583.1 Putative PD-(D/E)XK family member [Selenomonas ruminantium]
MEGSVSVDLVQAIKNHFALLHDGHVYPMHDELPGAYKAWVVRWNGKIGVAVPYDSEEHVYSSFAEIEVESCIINGEQVLYLFISAENNDKQWRSLAFANICENFVSPGEDGSNRDLVTHHTQEWCAKWKELLGNASREVPVHAVVGELMVYRWLLQQGLKPEWTAGKRRRLDFMTEDAAWEVKSTLSHTDLQITVNGQKQLTSQPDCPLDLMFCRMESNPQGESVNDMVQSLASLDIDHDMLEEALAGLGLKIGAFARKERFSLIEMRRYPVNEKFPRLTEESFVGGKLPDGIIKIDYVIDLANLEYEVLN